MKELLQEIKKKKNKQKTKQNREQKAPSHNRKHKLDTDCKKAAFFPINPLTVFRPSCSKGSSPVKKLIPASVEQPPRYLSGPYFTSCLGCLTHLIKSIGLVPSQPPHCLSLFQMQDNVQNAFQMEWFNMENTQFIQKERFSKWKSSKPLCIW